jgi:hypothetical protein
MSKIGDTVAFSDIKITATATPPSGTPFDLEISSLALRFTENSIPSAMLKIALGVSPQPGGGLKTARAHKRASDLERRSRIVIKGTFKGHKTVDERWDGKEITLFDGYLSRPAYTMGTSAASLVLEVDHWLSDLAATSKLSYLATPNTANDFTFPVLRTSFTGGKVCFDGTKMVYTPGAADDLWKAFDELFRFLADQDRINAKDIRQLGITEVKNTVATRALDRMNKLEKNPTLAITKNSPMLREQVAQSVALMITGKETGPSMWETLLHASRQFMFSVIPLVNTAVCAPVMKTAKYPLLRIKASEYNQISTSSNIRSLPLRSVGLFGRVNWTTLDTRGLTQMDPLIENSMMGYWDLAADLDDTAINKDIQEGQISLFQAPSWMWARGATLEKYTPKNVPRLGPINSLANAKANKRVDKDDKDVGDGEGGLLDTLKSLFRSFIEGDGKSLFQSFLEDDDDDDDGAREAPNRERKKLIEPNPRDRVGCQLARAYLSTMSFMHRTGSITGRLRFDIAPGSPIEIEIIGKNVPFYRGSSDNGNSSVLSAHVEQVDIDIDGVQPSARTTLHLTHMRTSSEQERFKSIVMDQHPLFQEMWQGAGLLDGSQNEEDA